MTELVGWQMNQCRCEWQGEGLNDAIVRGEGTTG